MKQSFRTRLALYFWPRKNWWGVRQAAASDWAVYLFFLTMVLWMIFQADGLLWIWGGWILLYLVCFIYFRIWPSRWGEMTDDMKLIYVRYNGTGKLTHEQQMEYQAILEDRLSRGEYQF